MSECLNNPEYTPIHKNDQETNAPNCPNSLTEVFEKIGVNTFIACSNKKTPQKNELPPRSLVEIQSELISIATETALLVHNYSKHLFIKNPDPRAQNKLVAQYTYAELHGWAKDRGCNDRFTPHLFRMIIIAAHNVLLAHFKANDDTIGVAATIDYFNSQMAVEKLGEEQDRLRLENELQAEKLRQEPSRPLTENDAIGFIPLVMQIVIREHREITSRPAMFSLYIYLGIHEWAQKTNRSYSWTAKTKSKIFAAIKETLKNQG